MTYFCTFCLYNIISFFLQLLLVYLLFMTQTHTHAKIKIKKTKTKNKIKQINSFSNEFRWVHRKRFLVLWYFITCDWFTKNRSSFIYSLFIFIWYDFKKINVCYVMFCVIVIDWINHHPVWMQCELLRLLTYKYS